MMPSTQVFRGRTVADARRAAEALFGEDLVVVSTRSVPRGGLAGFFGSSEIELVAAATARGPAAAHSPPAARTPFAPAAYLAAAGVTAGSREASTPRGEDIAGLRAEVRGELRALKTTLGQAQTQARTRPVAEENPALLDELAAMRAALDELTANAPKGDKVATLVRTRGIEGPAANAVLRALRDLPSEPGATPSERLRDALAAVVRVAPWPLASEGTTLVALVGPTGVGKTTTAAKLAARARAEKRAVTMIACDTYRVGAVEQLKRYAALLNADFAIARTPDELARAIAAAPPGLIIVDTSGRPPQKTGPEALLGRAAFEAAPARKAITRHVLLCVTASLRATDAARLARTFAPTGPTAVCVTKIDETTTPAGLVHAAVAADLPLAVLCDGQRVPEDVAPATRGAVLQHLDPRPRAGARAKAS